MLTSSRLLAVITDKAHTPMNIEQPELHYAHVLSAMYFCRVCILELDHYALSDQY